MTKVSRIRPAENSPVENLIKNYKTIKSYKITGKPNSIFLFLNKKLSLIRVFIQSRCNCGCLVSSDGFIRDFFDTTLILFHLCIKYFENTQLMFALLFKFH